jgi:hypothetical protein
MTRSAISEGECVPKSPITTRKRSRWLSSITFLVLDLGPVFISRAFAHRSELPVRGASLPAFSFRDESGEEERFEPSVIPELLLLVVKQDCGFCRQELLAICDRVLPRLEKPVRVLVISVSGSEGTALLRRDFSGRYRIVTPAGDTPRFLQGGGVPLLIISRNGVVRHAVRGVVPEEPLLEALRSSGEESGDAR